ncbi:MAG: hypothetical protein ACLRTR_05805 [Clostridia bacterium]
MPDVKQRMIDIVNSVPDDYFDGLNQQKWCLSLWWNISKGMEKMKLLLFRVLINILIMKILKKYLKIKI